MSESDGGHANPYPEGTGEHLQYAIFGELPGPDACECGMPTECQNRNPRFADFEKEIEKIMVEQWQSTLANDVRYIRNRMEGSINWWNLIQTLLLLWIGLGVWTRTA